MVILPAFGVTVQDFERLRGLGAVLVDTTCGSVLNVWKRVESYARDGFTALIHGKYFHEETRATASQVTKYPGGRYLVVFDMAEARQVCEFIEGRGDARGAGRAGSGTPMSPGFDFDRDLVRVGLANQTTMLSGESLAIADEVRESMLRRYGEAELPEHFRTFDTICSATQERQDAVLKLLEEPLDLMLVVGGYNSSNTTHLAALCRERGVRTYHIEDATAVDVDDRRAAAPAPDQGAGGDASTGWLDGVRSHRHHRRRLDPEQQDRRDGAPGLRRRRGGAGPPRLSPLPPSPRPSRLPFPVSVLHIAPAVASLHPRHVHRVPRRCSSALRRPRPAWPRSCPSDTGRRAYGHCSGAAVLARQARRVVR